MSVPPPLRTLTLPEKLSAAFGFHETPDDTPSGLSRPSFIAVSAANAESRSLNWRSNRSVAFTLETLPPPATENGPMMRWSNRARPAETTRLVVVKSPRRFSEPNTDSLTEWLLVCAGAGVSLTSRRVRSSEESPVARTTDSKPSEDAPLKTSLPIASDDRDTDSLFGPNPHGSGPTKRSHTMSAAAREDTKVAVNALATDSGILIFARSPRADEPLRWR